MRLCVLGVLDPGTSCTPSLNSCPLTRVWLVRGLERGVGSGPFESLWGGGWVTVSWLTECVREGRRWALRKVWQQGKARRERAHIPSLPHS